jgi:dephospho-CoA kinase
LSLPTTQVNPAPRIIGLTGGIACGKSAVERIFTECGATVIDADQLARAVVAPGSEGLREVVEAFGSHLLLDSGALDRTALGALVFADAEARARLNAILHPRIALASQQAIAGAFAAGAPLIVYSAALLVEGGTHRGFDGLLVVTCAPALQRARLASRDGLSQDEVDQRLAAQMPLADKAAAATWLLHNDGSLDDLRHATCSLAHSWGLTCPTAPRPSP